MDMAPLREAFGDKRGGRVCSLGLVVADDNGGAHYEVRSDDVWVRVELQPEQRPVWCRLAGMAGGRGVSMIPTVGDECVVLSPGGETHADPVLVAILSTGAVDGDMATRAVVITGNNVKISAIGSGTVSVNGGSVNIPKLGDSVQVSFPSGEYTKLSTGLPNGTLTLSGTITSATAGASRLKG